jgi:aminopeptidase N
MVCAVLGKEKFREGLQVYMRRHAYGNTETPDLWQARTHSVSPYAKSCP